MKVTTKEKIKKIRVEIEKGTSPADIKKKFFGTETKKIEYLRKWGRYFDDEEIAYLNNTDEETNNLTKDNIVRNIEEVEVAEVKTELEVAKTDTPNSLTVLENNFFKDENNLKSLIEMVRKYRNQNENLIEVIEAGIVNIPIEAKELELNTILSVRTNKEIYSKIIEMAQKNKAGKGEFLTYILWDFLKRNS